MNAPANTVTSMALVGLLSFASHASAACQWFGSQLECDAGMSRLRIGTQVSEPVYATRFRPRAFLGTGRLLGDPTPPARTLRLDLQNVGAQPDLCHRLGNETYCY